MWPLPGVRQEEEEECPILGCICGFSLRHLTSEVPSETDFFFYFSLILSVQSSLQRSTEKKNVVLFDRHFKGNVHFMVILNKS